MQEETEDWMETVEAYEMTGGMCKDKGVKDLKLIMSECPNTRDLTLEEKRDMRYATLSQNQCMNNRGESIFCIVNSKKVCISTVWANLI